MDVNHPQWEDYEARFRQLAAFATQVKTPKPTLDQCRYFLCLYGENGLPPEEEFELLNQMQAAGPENLRRLEVDADYWQDTVLFLP